MRCRRVVAARDRRHAKRRFGRPTRATQGQAVSFSLPLQGFVCPEGLVGAPDAPADRHRILTTPSGCAAPGCHAAAAPRTLCSAHAAVARLPGRAARPDGAGRARQRRQNGAPSTPMKRCAIYARFSTEMQRATSLDDQTRNCRRFAAQMGWPILDDHVYQDTAVSGFGVEQRPAYQRLVAAALAAVPPFTAILVDDLSRLSRDLVQTLSLFRRLQRHGVELVAVTDGIQTSHQRPSSRSPSRAWSTSSTSTTCATRPIAG